MRSCQETRGTEEHACTTRNAKSAMSAPMQLEKTKIAAQKLISY
jgi:hypothetical protein